MTILKPTLLLLVVSSALREQLRTYDAFELSSTSPGDLALLLPPLTVSITSFTLDLSFRLDSAASSSFLLLGFSGAGVEQSTTSLRPLSFPSPCDLSTQFKPNTWNQITISVSSGALLTYSLNLTPGCTTAAALPDSSLDSLSLLF